jgi:tetratricopeptide (TPR) repeat protein
MRSDYCKLPLLLATLMVWHCCCLAQAAAPTDGCTNSLRKAIVANELDNATLAIQLIDSCLATCNNRLHVVVLNTAKAQAFNQLKLFGDALAAAELAIPSSGPDNFEAHGEKAVALYGLHQKPAADMEYQLLKKKLSHSGKQAVIFTQLAKIEIANSQSSKALAYIQKALVLDASKPDYYLLYGDCAASQNDTTTAMQQYSMALEHHADEQVVLRKKAMAYTRYLQEKYHVHDAKEQRMKMGIAEKQQYCDYWKTLFITGYTNAQEELNFRLICL